MSDLYQYAVHPFKELSVNELYLILALRENVFAVEQNSVYTDLDFLDQKCRHLCMWDGQTLAGYARIVPPGVKFEDASIGRIVLDMAHRGKGNGKRLMQESINYARKHYPDANIRIEAQEYLEKFYRQFGFEKVSEPYDWGGIAHIKMLACA